MQILEHFFKLVGYKTPGGRGIAVRTKWQSGLPVWQRWNVGLKGKPPDRQREVARGEIQPDQSRKIYPARHRMLLPARLHSVSAVWLCPWERRLRYA